MPRVQLILLLAGTNPQIGPVRPGLRHSHSTICSVTHLTTEEGTGPSAGQRTPGQGLVAADIWGTDFLKQEQVSSWIRSCLPLLPGSTTGSVARSHAGTAEGSSDMMAAAWAPVTVSLQTYAQCRVVFQVPLELCV